LRCGFLFGRNLFEQDGHEHARYYYDEFGIPTDEIKFDVNWPGP